MIVYPLLIDFFSLNLNPKVTKLCVFEEICWVLSCANSVYQSYVQLPLDSNLIQTHGLQYICPDHFFWHTVYASNFSPLDERWYANIKSSPKLQQFQFEPFFFLRLHSPAINLDVLQYLLSHHVISLSGMKISLDVNVHADSVQRIFSKRRSFYISLSLFNDIRQNCLSRYYNHWTNAQNTRR